MLFVSQLASHSVFKMFTFRQHLSSKPIMPLVMQSARSTTTMLALSHPTYAASPGVRPIQTFPIFSPKTLHKSPSSTAFNQVQTVNKSFIFFGENHFKGFSLHFQDYKLYQILMQ